jgi:hypothetical protein
VAAHPHKYQLGVDGLVNEEQIPSQVTFPKVPPIADQRMIAEMGGQCVALLQHGDGFGETFQIASCPSDGLKVLLELPFPDDFAHIRS